MDSDLTGNGYIYDMVIAATQQSINATLKEYIVNILPDQFIQAYHDNFAHANYESLLKEINGTTQPGTSGYIDLFNIIDEHPKGREKDALTIANRMGIKYVLKATFIIPNIKTPDLVELVPVQNNLIYSAYYTECHILVIGTDFSIRHIVQPPLNPWIFGYQVNLSLASEKFNNLPVDLQDELKNNHQEITDFDSDFSIQELILNLEKATFLYGPKDIPESDYSVIKSIYLDSYIRKLLEAGGIGGNVFGYSLKKKKEQSIESNDNSEENVIEPTDYDYFMSEFSEPNRHDLYTLNYLVVCDNKTLPKEKKPFPWDWVDKSSSVYAVMAISRGKIFDLMKKMFNPLLNRLTLYPTAHCEIDWLKNRSFSYGMHADHINASYTEATTPQGENELYYGGYERSAESSDKNMWGTKVHIKITYSLESQINMSDDDIICSTNVVSRLTLDDCGDSYDGNAYNHTLICKVKLSVNEDGFIHFTASPIEDKDNENNSVKSITSSIDDSQIKTVPNIQSLSKAIIGNDFDSKVKHIRNFISDHINNSINMYKREAFTDINNVNNWILPTNKSFFSKDIKFSNYKDLTVSLTYSEPKEEKEI